MTKKISTVVIGFVIIFAVIMCGVLLVFDGLIVSTFVKQQGANRSYLPVDAVVTNVSIRSTVSSVPGNARRDSDFKPVIEYGFEINGQQYTGDQYSFVLWGRGNPDYPQSIIDQYPVGSAITVYYDPSDPAQSVIDRSFDEFPMVVALLLIPFHCFVAFLICSIRYVWRHKDLEGDDLWIAYYRIEPRDQYTVSAGEDRSVFRDFAYPIWGVFLATLLVSSFISTWFHLLLGRGFNSSYASVWLTIAGCLVLALIITVRQARRIFDPQRRLTIDRSAGHVTRGDRTLNTESIRSVEIETTTKMKNNREGWCTHTARARLADGSMFDLLVCRGHKEHSRVLKRVMKKELGL